MSLILEALRKMEQDRNNRRGAAQNIRPEVLRYRGASKPARTLPYLPVVLGLVLLACGIGAGFFLKGSRARNGSEAVSPAVSTLPATPVMPVTPDKPVTSMTEQPVTPVLPVSPITPVTPAAPVAPVRAVPSAGPAAAVPVAAPEAEARAVPAAAQPVGTRPVRQPAAAARPRPQADRAAQQKPVHREAAAALQAAPADITISGIAWQDERSLRRAVVNGALVGEGAEVAGARVLEIREDRVRLTRGGQVFDAVFSSGFAR